MGRYDYPGADHHFLLLQDKIIGNEIDEYIEHEIAAPDGQVPERRNRHHPGKRRIEEIYYIANSVPCL